MSRDISAKARKVLGDDYDSPIALHSPSQSATGVDLSLILGPSREQTEPSKSRIFSNIFKRGRKRSGAPSTASSSCNGSAWATARASRKPSLDQIAEEAAKQPAVVSQRVRRSLSSPDLYASHSGSPVPASAEPLRLRPIARETNDTQPNSAFLAVPRPLLAGLAASRGCRPPLSVNAAKKQRSSRILREDIYSPTQPSIHSSIFHQPRRRSSGAPRRISSNFLMESQVPNAAQWFEGIRHEGQTFQPFLDDADSSDDEDSKHSTLRAPSTSAPSDAPSQTFLAGDSSSDTDSEPVMKRAGRNPGQYFGRNFAKRDLIQPVRDSSRRCSTSSSIKIEAAIVTGKSVLSLSDSDNEPEIQPPRTRVPKATNRSLAPSSRDCKGIDRPGQFAHRQPLKPLQTETSRLASRANPRRAPGARPRALDLQTPQEPAKMVPRDIEVSPDDARLLIGMREKRLDLWRSKFSAGYVRALELEISVLEAVQYSGVRGHVRITSDLLPPGMGQGELGGLGTLFPLPPRTAAHVPRCAASPRECTITEVLEQDEVSKSEKEFGSSTDLKGGPKYGSPLASPMTIDAISTSEMDALDDFYMSAAGAKRLAFSWRPSKAPAKSSPSDSFARSSTVGLPQSNRTSFSQASDVFSITPTESMPATPSTSYSFLERSNSLEQSPLSPHFEPFPAELQQIARREALCSAGGAIPSPKSSTDDADWTCGRKNEFKAEANEPSNLSWPAHVERSEPPVHVWEIPTAVMPTDKQKKRPRAHDIEAKRSEAGQPRLQERRQAKIQELRLQQPEPDAPQPHAPSAVPQIALQVDAPTDDDKPADAQIQDGATRGSSNTNATISVPEMILTPPTAAHSRSTSTAEDNVGVPVIDKPEAYTPFNFSLDTDAQNASDRISMPRMSGEVDQRPTPAAAAEQTASGPANAGTSSQSLRPTPRAAPMLEERIRTFGTPVWSPAAQASKPKGHYSLFPGQSRHQGQGLVPLRRV